MPDNIIIEPGTVSGKVAAYPSKSHIQRALILGLLNNNGIEIGNYGASDDSKAVLEAISALGAEVKFKNNILSVKGLGKFTNSEIFCNESGLCLRLFAPILALSGEESRIRGTEGLLKRANGHISGILGKIGVQCVLERDILKVKGPLRSGSIKVEDTIGSQLISGLLFALSKVQGDSCIELVNPVSFPYIKMTAQILNRFGAGITIEDKENIYIKGRCEFMNGKLTIEGDWSSAAFFLVAGAVSGKVTVSGLDRESVQADKDILRYLENAGAEVSSGNGSVTVRKSDLKGFTADVRDCPDLFIPLAVLGLNCEGETKLFNYNRLRYKESDRPSALITELRKTGARIGIRDDHISIKRSVLRYEELDTYNDHRLAMGFSVAALNSEKGLIVKGPACVNKSFPSFFESLDHLRRK